MEAGRKRPRTEEYQYAERAIHKVAASAALHKHRASLAHVRHFTSVAKHEALKAELATLEAAIDDAERTVAATDQEASAAEHSLVSPFADWLAVSTLLRNHISLAQQSLSAPDVEVTSGSAPSKTDGPLRALINAVLIAHMERHSGSSLPWGVLTQKVLSTVALFEPQNKRTRKALSKLVESTLAQICTLRGSPLKRVGETGFWFQDRVRALGVSQAVSQEAQLAVKLLDGYKQPPPPTAPKLYQAQLPSGIEGLPALAFSARDVPVSESTPGINRSPRTEPVRAAASGAGSGDFVLDFSGAVDSQQPLSHPGRPEGAPGQRPVHAQVHPPPGATDFTAASAATRIGWLACLSTYALNEQSSVFAAFSVHTGQVWTAALPCGGGQGTDEAMPKAHAAPPASIALLRHFSSCICGFAEEIIGSHAQPARLALGFVSSVLQALSAWEPAACTEPSVQQGAPHSALAQAIHAAPIRAGVFLTLQEVALLGALVHRDKFAGLTAMPPEFRATDAAVGSTLEPKSALQVLVLVSILRACVDGLLGGEGFNRQARADGAELSSAAAHYLHVLLLKGGFVVPEKLAQDYKIPASAMDHALAGEALCSESELMQALLASVPTLPSYDNFDAAAALPTAQNSGAAESNFIQMASCTVGVDVESLAAVLEVLLGQKPHEKLPPSQTPMFSGLTVKEAKDILRAALERGMVPNQAAVKDFLRLARGTSSSNLAQSMPAEASVCTLAAHVLLPGLKQRFDFQAGSRFILQAKNAGLLCDKREGECGTRPQAAQAMPLGSLESDRATAPATRGQLALKSTAAHIAALSQRFVQVLQETALLSSSNVLGWTLHCQTAVGVMMTHPKLRKATQQSEGILFVLALVCGDVPAPIMASRYAQETHIAQTGPEIGLLRAVKNTLLHRRLLMETFSSSAPPTTDKSGVFIQPWRARSAFTWLHKQLLMTGSESGEPRCTSWILLILLSKRLENPTVSIELDEEEDLLSIVRQWSEASPDSSQALLTYAHFKLHSPKTFQQGNLERTKKFLEEVTLSTSTHSEKVRFAAFTAIVILECESGFTSLALARLQQAVAGRTPGDEQSLLPTWSLGLRVRCLVSLQLCGIFAAAGELPGFAVKAGMAGCAQAVFPAASRILHRPNLPAAMTWSQQCGQVLVSTFASIVGSGKPTVLQFRRAVAACLSQAPQCRTDISTFLRLLAQSKLKGIGEILRPQPALISALVWLETRSRKQKETLPSELLAVLSDADVANGRTVLLELQTPGTVLAVLSKWFLFPGRRDAVVRALKRFSVAKMKFTGASLKHTKSFSWASLSTDGMGTQSMLDVAGDFAAGPINASTALVEVQSAMVTTSALLACGAAVATAEAQRILRVAKRNTSELLDRYAASVLLGEEDSFERLQCAAVAGAQVHLAQLDAVLIASFPGEGREELPQSAPNYFGPASPGQDCANSPEIALGLLAFFPTAAATTPDKPSPTLVTQILQVLWGAINLFKRLRWLALASQPASITCTERHLHAWASASLADMPGMERFGAAIIDCLDVEWVNVLEDFFFAHVMDLVGRERSAYGAALAGHGVTVETLLCKLSCPPPTGMAKPSGKLDFGPSSAIWDAQRFAMGETALAFETARIAPSLKPFMQLQASTFPSLLHLDAVPVELKERLHSSTNLLRWEYLSNLPGVRGSALPRSVLLALRAESQVPASSQLVRAVLAQYISIKQPSCISTWNLRFTLALSSHSVRNTRLLLRLAKEAMQAMWPTAAFHELLLAIMATSLSERDVNNIIKHLFVHLGVASPPMRVPLVAADPLPATTSASKPAVAAPGQSKSAAAKPPKDTIAVQAASVQCMLPHARKLPDIPWHAAERASEQALLRLAQWRQTPYKDALAGYIFMCNGLTEQQVLANGYAAMPFNATNQQHGQRIYTNRTKLFLANYQSRELFGVFIATSRVKDRKDQMGLGAQADSAVPLPSAKKFPLGCNIRVWLRAGPVPFSALHSLRLRHGSSRLPNVLSADATAGLLRDLAAWVAAADGGQGGQARVTPDSIALQQRSSSSSPAARAPPALSAPTAGAAASAGASAAAHSIRWLEDLEGESDMDLSPASTDIDEDAAEDSS